LDQSFGHGGNFKVEKVFEDINGGKHFEKKVCGGRAIHMEQLAVVDSDNNNNQISHPSHSSFPFLS
jgi:hypothetical protein